MSELVLTKNIRDDRTPMTLAEYETAGGYEGMKKALSQDATDVIATVKDAGLRGRGGAGFPSGVKWSFMPRYEDRPEERPDHVYLVCNADEMEPGTFKDRLLMEGDPHQFIEGLIIASYAIGADIAYIFLRGEYSKCWQTISKALDEAKEAGYLGDNILGTDFSLQIIPHMSAGRYICGEETALLSALEGRRAIPRAKPPFPAASGLFGRPTTVNNVETLCNAPHILRNGADWFKGLTRNKDAGTKIYGASGHINKPGLVEMPFGTPLGELIEHFGGIRDGHELKAVQPGGGSTPLLTKEHWDTPMDYEGLAAHGQRMGTGTMIVMDETTSIVGVLKNLEHFYAQESCGWCTPCRDGLPWVEQMLTDLEAGRGKPGDIELLELHTRLLGPGKTFCAHAPGAMDPLKSALQHFWDELEALIPAEQTVES